MSGTNRFRTVLTTGAAAALSLALTACQTTPAAKPTAEAQPASAAAAAPARPAMAKICGNCHTAQEGSLRGNFDGVAYKTQSIQVKMDDVTEVLRFDAATVKIENVKGENAEEPLRDLPKGKEVRVEYTEKDGKKFATLIVAKPPVKVAAEKMLGTEDVEKLVAMGPEQGKYLLIDARPPMKALEGIIPTAINIPFVAFDKHVDKLPKDKDTLIIYYCQGVT